MKAFNSFISVVLALVVLLGIVPVGAAASQETDAENVKLQVSSVSAYSGGTVDVVISVAENPGLTSLKFDVTYDDVLTLKNVAFNSGFGDYTTTPNPYKNPQTLSMISPFAPVTTNGAFATLTFSVSEDAQIGYEATVTISYEADDIFDSEYKNVPVTVINGVVTVVCNHAYGDWEQVDENYHKHTCTVCKTHAETKKHNFGADHVCTDCGYRAYIVGDFTGDGYITDEDVIYLLWYTVFPEDYPLNQSGDIDGDGYVTDADVIYLLWYTVFPEDYPLK